MSYIYMSNKCSVFAISTAKRANVKYIQLLIQNQNTSSKTIGTEVHLRTSHMSLFSTTAKILFIKYILTQVFMEFEY